MVDATMLGLDDITAVFHRDALARMMVNISTPLWGGEPGLTLEEAYARVDQHSHGPRLSEAIPPHLDLSNTWWWLPEEYGDDD